MSAYFDDDLSRSSYDELRTLMARWAEGPTQLEGADRAWDEFWRRRGEYVVRKAGSIWARLATPVNMAELLAFVIMSLRQEAGSDRQSCQRAEPGKELKSINDWIKLSICGSLLRWADDSQLIAQIKCKDAGAAEMKLALKALWEIQTRHEVNLAAYCRSLVRNKFDAGVAHDLTQNTFLRVLDKAGTYDCGGLANREELSGRTQAWLQGVARNLCRDIWREHKRRREINLTRREALEAIESEDKAWVETHAAGETGAGENAGGDASQLQALHYECMQQALDNVRLTERERDVFEVSKRTYFANERERRQALRELELRRNIKKGNRRKILSRVIAKHEDYVAARCGACRQIILEERRKELEESRRKQERKKAAADGAADEAA
jgi:DNA-directed RNA polymerase specialized sigma24 family protein